MKRLHVHVAVTDLDRSTAFYSTLFDVQPTVVKDDYAKWLLDDPAVNFAISTRAGRDGLDHLGLQVDTDAEVEEIEAILVVVTLAGRSASAAPSAGAGFSGRGISATERKETERERCVEDQGRKARGRVVSNHGSTLLGYRCREYTMRLL